MAEDSSEQVLVRVAFTMTDTDGTVFRDALSMTQESYASQTPESLRALKHERFNKWKQTLAAIAARPQEDPIELIAGIDMQIQDLEKQREQQVQTVAEYQKKPIDQVEQEVVSKVQEIKETIAPAAVEVVDDAIEAERPTEVESVSPAVEPPELDANEEVAVPEPQSEAN